jgi:hypothetical protein
MPFTFSHPAAILPLTYLPKRWTSISGLVIGSLAPDFEYFLRMRVYSSYSHTWTGILWFDLPLAIILAFTFHLHVRNSLIDNLPSFLAKRFLVFKDFNWTQHFKDNFFVVIVSVLFGVATHIIWDNFTHEHGLFVQTYDGLQNTFNVAGHSIVTYKLLQHSSTIVGGLIILYALFQLPIDNNFQRQKSIFRFWFLVGVITFVVVVGRLLTGLDYKLYGNVIVTGITGGLLGLVVTPKLIAKN